MKKTLLTSFAVVAFAFTSIAFAAKETNKYYSSLQAKTQTVLNGKAQFVPPTDITIVNSTYNPVYVLVPQSPINDLVYSGNNDHIRHDSLYADTRIVLQDPYHNTFFDRFVCRRAVVSIMGGPGSYRVNIDNEYCF